MKVKSTIETGFRTDGINTGEPLLKVGMNDFGGRRLETGERDLIRELAKENIVEIIEDDPPADVIPIAPAIAKRKAEIESLVPKQAPSKSMPGPMRRRIIATTTVVQPEPERPKAKKLKRLKKRKAG